MAHRIVFPEKNHVELEKFDPDPVAADSVRVRTTFSLMSTGTEGIALRGLFDPGTHWADWVSYPFHPGYAAVGVVEEVGPDVTDLVIGDLVAARLPHASEHTVPAARCTPIPQGIAPEEATWFALAKIALMGAHVADIQLGDAVAVVGAGPIGQMAIRWANAAGATSIAAIDPGAGRLRWATDGGATALIAASIDEAAEQITEAFAAAKPRVVIDTTGNAAVFASALRVVADRGRLVLLGDTGSPAGQHLTPDVVLRGVSIVGAHDGHSVTPHAWDFDRRHHQQFFDLVRSGRFSLEGLNTHAFSPADCAAAYDLATQRRGDTMGIVFEWLQL